jgi:hypothetical protein
MRCGAPKPSHLTNSGFGAGQCGTEIQPASAATVHGPQNLAVRSGGHRGCIRGGAGLDNDKGAGGAFRRVRDDLTVRGPSADVEAAGVSSGEIIGRSHA